MVENTNQYLEKTEIEGFGGNLFLYKRLENANADSKDIWHYRAKIVGMKGYVRRSTKETNFELAKRKAEQDYIDNTYKFKNKLEKVASEDTAFVPATGNDYSEYVNAKIPGTKIKYGKLYNHCKACAVSVQEKFGMTLFMSL